MPDIDHAALKRAALAATRGEWAAVENNGIPRDEFDSIDPYWGFSAGRGYYDKGQGFSLSGFISDSDAAYIVAAQPRAVLALLDEIERLRGALASANHLCRSALSIAERHGDDTNWWAFTANLKTELLRQHAVLWPTAALNPKEATDA